MHLFAVERDHYRKLQLVKMQRTTDPEMSDPNRYIYNTAPEPLGNITEEEVETLEEPECLW